MKNKVLIVVGMHRSGTSLISQWLHKCGLNLGDEFLGPSVGNKQGHFEDVDFLNFHEGVLVDHQLPATGLLQRQVVELSFLEKIKLEELIEKKNKKNKEWGWKDPRTCLFLSAYRELIPNAFYLVIVRDVESTVNSLIHRLFVKANSKERGFLDMFLWKTIRRKLRRRKLYSRFSEEFLKVWIAYTEAILDHISKISSNHFKALDYNLLKGNDKSIYSFLQSTWNFNLTYVDFNNVYKESLMHSHENLELFLKDKNLLLHAKGLENKLRSFI